MDVLPTQLIPPPLVKLFLVRSHLPDALSDTFDAKKVNAKEEEKLQPLTVQKDISAMSIGDELR